MGTAQRAAPLKLMCVFAHPDDESLGMGSTLAKYAAEGIETYLVTATRGERGWQGEEHDNPGLAALGELRTRELAAAADVLGIRVVAFLDYIDGDLDQADPAEAVAKIVAHLRRVKPQVVVTFGPEGGYGHPDHIAISQLTAAAIVRAADADYLDPECQPAHRVLKLYYMVDTKADVAVLLPTIGDIVMPVDGVPRHIVGWEDWAVTTRIDGSAYIPTTLRAISCHTSQIQGYPDFETLSPEQKQALAGVRSYYRALSLVNGGRRIETDLFEGVRE